MWRGGQRRTSRQEKSESDSCVGRRLQGNGRGTAFVFDAQNGARLAALSSEKVVTRTRPGQPPCKSHYRHYRQGSP